MVLLYLCRNRQLTVFLATVDWFQPAFVLMENVQASWTGPQCEGE
mgnify:CR=1 FL=1